MSWLDEAKRQESTFKKLSTRDAFAVVAYWRRERGGPEASSAWVPITAKLLREGPEPERKTSRLIASDRLLNILFGETSNHPAINNDARAEVFDYALQMAREIDAGPKAKLLVPELEFNKNSRAQGLTLAAAFIFERKTPVKSAARKFPGALLLVAFVLLASKGRR